jgi:bacterioferritin-associated ferredoxin
VIAVLGDGAAARAAVAVVAAHGAAVAQFGEDACVWSVSGGPLEAPDAAFRIDTVRGGALRTHEAGAIIVIARHDPVIVPFPGWTLAGIGAAPDIPPGARIVRAGGRVRAAEGAHVVATIDPRRDRILRALGTDRLEAIEIAGDTVRRIDCDALCIVHGWSQDTRVARILGAHHIFDPDAGGWVPALDSHGRTTIPRLYVTSRTAAAAKRAAQTALSEQILPSLREGLGEGPGKGPWEGLAPSPIPKTLPPPTLYDAIPDDTLICPCEHVARRDIDRAAALGARTMNTLRQSTRCGMGPCQGRLCAEPAAELLARHVGGRDAAGQWTARVPLSPLPIAALMHGFAYADLPVPPPAPI